MSTVETQTTSIPPDLDAVETAEWLESLEYVLKSKGPERVRELLTLLDEKALREGIDLPFSANTPYINTIPAARTPLYPGNRELERRIKSIVRWNAMAMVTRANREQDGIGGHISSFASSATLFEVAQNHFFRGKGPQKVSGTFSAAEKVPDTFCDGYDGDQIYFQGHASPGMYARAYLEGRLTDKQLINFRRELQPGGGLSSYPHPWLMPQFWEFPTVSMGLSPLMAIYQARFNRYLQDRGFKDTSGQHVWAFLGDGECDEPETLGAITLASREKLDNLIFVINCNLQRLDGPVRGNGKIIQELEAIFRGAGWNVIKVIWGGDWDRLLERDTSGLLVKRMGECVDGEYQKYVVSSGDYIREHFFGKYPELLELVKHLSDEKLQKLKRGGHDPEKVFAAYQAAVDSKGRPTVILAKTIKGYGLGEAGEGRNKTHQQKKLDEEELREFRTRFGIPISDEDVSKAPFYKPPANSEEMKYLRSRREALGGCVPARGKPPGPIDVPTLPEYREFIEKQLCGKEMSTTMGFVRLLSRLLKDPKIGRRIVPIVPDESRTFGMEALFPQCGIYSGVGQLYEPVDSDQLLYYKEAKDGQILEEGITEAGSMASFIAAGTAHTTHGAPMIPMFIYYSMFGFQRIGDLIWAACDARTRGFMLGGTAGRTTLNGEGLQHQDGHSLLNAIAFPYIRSYDPTFAYETAVIVLDGIRRMYHDEEDAIYYLTLENENYDMRAMPADCEEGILRGIHRLDTKKVSGTFSADEKVPDTFFGFGAHVQLLGAGAILHSVVGAQELLAEKYGVSSTVWSVTSWTQLRRDAQAAERWNMLHPDQPPRQSYLAQVTAGLSGPFIAASDYVRAVPEQLSPYVPGGLFVLGTDGFGRSDSRAALRRHFEVDAECVTLAALYQLTKRNQWGRADLAATIRELGIDPEKVDPLTA